MLGLKGAASQEVFWVFVQTMLGALADQQNNL